MLNEITVQTIKDVCFFINNEKAKGLLEALATGDKHNVFMQSEVLCAELEKEEILGAARQLRRMVNSII